MSRNRDHPLALPTGAVLAAMSPTNATVEYLHAAVPNDPLDPTGVLTGADELTAAVWATLDGSNEFIDGDDELVWLHSLTEQHPTGISTVVPCMCWFLDERDSLPDLAIAIAAVMPSGSILNAVLDQYLRRVEQYGDDCARDAELGL